MSEADREAWNARYAARAAAGTPPRPPAPFVVANAGRFPRSGRALDLAGGDGRHALWLARRGLDVTLADLSEVALDLARRHALAQGLTLQTLLLDVELDPLPPGPWDLLLVVDFHWRPLAAAARIALAPGGLLAVAQATRANLARHPRPGPRHLLDEGELADRAKAAGLEIVHAWEGWTPAGRHEAHLIARQPPDTPPPTTPPRHDRGNSAETSDSEAATPPA